MRLSASFNEWSPFEIQLTRFPSYFIYEMAKRNELKDYSVKVNMTKKINMISSPSIRNPEEFKRHQNSHRHQIVLEKIILSGGKYSSKAYITLKIYSMHMNAQEIRSLGLEPILKAESFEEQQLMMNKLVEEPKNVELNYTMKIYSTNISNSIVGVTK